MIVYRLVQKKYSPDLEGKGAELAGGRWNSRGLPMIYTSGSIALCTVEIAVHLPLGILPAAYEILAIEIPEIIAVDEITETALPEGWKSFPYKPGTQSLGDTFLLKKEHLVLKVPSAVIKGEFNYLLSGLLGGLQERKAWLHAQGRPCDHLPAAWSSAGA